MAKLFSRFVFWLTGWKVVGAFPEDVRKAVMIAAPHTSNWDLLYARCAFFLLDIPLRYTIKKELMVGPVGWMLRMLGAIPIDRSKTGARGKRSMVDAMADLFDEYEEELVVMVTPEGTRKYAPRWKTGFYRVAEKAQVPIVLGYLDYAKKHAGVGPVFNTTGDIDKDIEEIQAFYRTKTARYPEQGVR